MADEDDVRRRTMNTEDRTVLGAAPLAGGPTMASTGAFDTPGGGDLGGPGSRDPGDTTSHLRDPVDQRGSGGLNEQQDQLRAQAGAQGSDDATDARDLQDDTRAQADLGSANNTNSL